MSRNRIVASVMLAALLATGLVTAMPGKASAAPLLGQPTITKTTKQHAAPCPTPSKHTCTITETLTVTKIVRFVGKETAPTSGATPYAQTGPSGGCSSGTNNVTDQYRYSNLGIYYWTATMYWNYNWSDCSPIYINTTYFDYNCQANGWFATCTSIQNTGVSDLYWCTSGTQCRLAHADFYGAYGTGGWAAYMRVQGWEDGEVFKPNTINA